MKKIFILIITSSFVMNISQAQDMENLIEKVYVNKAEPGVSVTIRNDEKVGYYSFGLANLEAQQPIDSLTNFRMASVSKQFTAMAIYRLIEEGKLDFNTKVRAILPELPLETNRITIGQFLNHSSGIVDYENLIESGKSSQLTDADVLSYLRNVDSLYFEPGSQFRYSNSTYCLLALIVERLTKKDYPAAIQKLIFEPLAIRNASVYPTEDSSKRAFGYHPDGLKFVFADQSLTSGTKGDGGIYISASDYNKWANTANSLFSEAYWEALDKHKILVKDNIYYSLGWFVQYNDNEEPVVFHSGESTGFHNIILFDPIRNKTRTIFSNRDDLKIAALFDQMDVDFEEYELPNKLFLWLNKVYMNQ